MKKNQIAGIESKNVVLCLILGVGLSSGVAAETQGDSSNNSTSRMLEEVVVTAQKRVESAQDVPISIQAFSGEKLDAMGIEDPKGLQLVTPGMQYNVVAGYSIIYIRGVGTDAFIPSADASVATYIDNVYYPFGHSLASALGSVERIEVLKGPQGTLFGRNSTGGAVNIITKSPSLDSLYSNVTATYGSNDKRNIKVFANIPVSDSFAVSFSGLKYTEGQYYKLHEDSPRDSFRDEESDGYSIKAAWYATPDFSIELGLREIKTSGEQSMWLPSQDPKPLGRALGITEHKPYKNAQDAETFVDTDSEVITMDLKYSLPRFDTRFIFGEQEISSPALADYDGSEQPLVTFSVPGQFADIRTAEFQLLSNQDTWAAEWMEWVAGIYYIDSSAGYDPDIFSIGPGLVSYLASPPSSGPLADLAVLTEPLFGALASAPLPVDFLTLLNSGVNLALEGVLDTESTAVFFQNTIDLSESLSLTLGGRYQVESRALVKSTTSFIASRDDYDNGTLLFDFGRRKTKTENFSPKVVVDYKLFDDDLLYLSYTKGFKSGTYNMIAIYSPTQYVEPEETESYEIGYKGTMLDGTLRLNAAIFENRIDQLQVQTISLTSGGAVRFENAGSAKIEGAEFDLLWQVLPDILPGLVITGSGSYLNGIYTSYKNGSGFDKDTGLFFDGTAFPTRDFTGNETVRTPQWSGTLGVSYNVDVGPGNLEVASDVYYNSGFYFSSQNLRSSEEDEYYVTNARVSYLFYDWNVRFSVYGKNINNALYHYGSQEVDFGTANLYAPDASYGLRINWEWEYD